METYIVGVWDKATKWFIGFYEVEAESREQAEKIFNTNSIIKITEKKSLKEEDNNAD